MAPSDWLVIETVLRLAAFDTILETRTKTGSAFITASASDICVYLNASRRST